MKFLSPDLRRNYVLYIYTNTHIIHHHPSIICIAFIDMKVVVFFFLSLCLAAPPPSEVSYYHRWFPPNIPAYDYNQGYNQDYNQEEYGGLPTPPPPSRGQGQGLGHGGGPRVSHTYCPSFLQRCWWG